MHICQVKLEYQFLTKLIIMHQKNVQSLKANELQEIKGGCATCGKTLNDRFSNLFTKSTIKVLPPNTNCPNPTTTSEYILPKRFVVKKRP